MNRTRRDFLKKTAGGSAVISLAGNVPAFLAQAAAAGAEGHGERILVVIQLSGGNDGLNTVVPYADDAYHRARPNLGMGAARVLKIDERLGLHPNLQGARDLLEASKLSIVQGVGYPNPNRSHFESMDIWHTCQRKDENRRDGWLGRFLDQSFQNGERDLRGIHLGRNKQPFALAARETRVPSIQDVRQFRLQGSSADRIRELLAANKPTPAANDLLSFVQSSTAAALHASQRMTSVMKNESSAAGAPRTPLAQKLGTIAQLIGAELATRIYYVELNGFDTHSEQANSHAALLRQWSGAIKAFMDEIERLGHADRVLVMSFSEFGRRVKENASRGTDHGTAAPMFFAGNHLNAGLIGAHPSLAKLDQGDLRFHTDFRSVYATVLEEWLGWKSEPVIGGAFPKLRLFV